MMKIPAPSMTIAARRFLTPARWCRAAVRCLLRRPSRLLVIVLLLGLIGFGAALDVIHLEALHHLRAARTEVERYHNAEAQRHLQACLGVWPRNADALLLAARTARRLGNFEIAVDFLDQYQRLRGADDDLVLEQVLLRAERGEVDEVSTYCHTLVDQDHPAQPLILEALAAGYLRTYRLKDASGCLDFWLERQPDNTQALLLQGMLHEHRLRQQEAVTAYRRIVQLDPEHDDARLHLASTLVEMGRATEAVPHLEYLQRRQPDNLMVPVYLARCQDRLGELAEAEQLVDAVLARRPNYPPALAERAKLAFEADRFAVAEDWLRQAGALMPGDMQVHHQLYLCLEKNQKHEEARAEQAWLKQIEGDMQRIQEIATVRMQQAPHDASLHCEVGMISLRAGSPAEGLRWLLSALKEDARYLPAHRALADYYQRTGQPARAARHLEFLQQATGAPSPPATVEKLGR